MTEPPTTGMADTQVGDRAVALLRGLEALRTDEPEIPRWHDRLLARAIDVGCELAACMLVLDIGGLVVLLAFPHEDDDFWKYDPGAPEIAVSLAFAFACVAAVMINEAGFAGRHGTQTVGLRLTGIVVVREDGDPASKGVMFGRFAAWLVALLAGFGLAVLAAAWLPLALSFLVQVALLAGTLWAFIGRDGRALHDRLFGVRLIRHR